MIETPLGPRVKFAINVRPVKFAYFAWHDDYSGLGRAMRFACTQWGGIRALMIPVGRDMTIAPIFRQFLRSYEPEGFISYLDEEPTLTATGKLRAQLHALLPGRELTVLGGDAFEENDYTVHAVGAFTRDDVARHLPTMPGLLAEGPGDAFLLPVRRFAGDEGDDWLPLALYGHIFPGQQDLYEQLFVLNPHILALGSAEFWSSQLRAEPFASILNLTGYGIVRRHYKAIGFVESNHFDVVLVNSPASLCFFWNLRGMREALQADRSLGRRTVLLPASLLDRDEAMAALLDTVRANVLHPLRRADAHVGFYADGEEGEYQLALRLSGMAGVERLTHGVMRSGTERSKDAPRAPLHLGDQNVVYVLSDFNQLDGRTFFPLTFEEGVDREPPLTVSLQLGENELFFEPPATFRNRFGQEVAVDFQSDIWQRYLRAPGITQAIVPAGHFTRYGLTTRLMLDAEPQYLHFTLPNEWETLRRFFEARGYAIQPSMAGKYGAAVVRLVGGLSGVELLATREAYRVLNSVALKSTMKIGQRLAADLALSDERIDDLRPILADLQAAAELVGVPKTYEQLCSALSLPRKERPGLLRLLGRLAEAQVLKRGFLLPCPRCAVSDWYPLDGLREELVCTGCSNAFTLPVEDRKGAEARWQFRLNTLVNRAVDQDVLPNVLGLYRATEGRPYACITTGLELLRDDRAARELDFMFVSDQQLHGGECKSGTGLMPKDFETARVAAELGFTSFSFCTVSRFGQATQEEIRSFTERLRADGLSMAVKTLSGNELLSTALLSPMSSDGSPTGQAGG